MKRRDLLAALVGLGFARAPIFAFAQARPAGRPFRIVITARHGPRFDALFAARMKALGWRAGQDYIAIEPVGMILAFDKVELNISLAMREKPDLLLVGSTAGAVEAQRQSKIVPIVMLGSGYPVEAGVADSLARPGRNVTGNSVYAGTGVWGKMLELLSEAKPGIKRVGILWGYAPPAFPVAEIEPCYEEFRNAAKALGLSIRIIEVRNPDQLAGAVREFTTDRVDALFTSTWLTLVEDWRKVMELAALRKLPIISDFTIDADPNRHGPLMTLSPNREELWGQAISYIDRILRGAKAGDLPIQRPSKFELTVNLKSAAAVGLVVPKPLLARADRVIE